MIFIETFERETFRVKGVRVTSTNMEEVAVWCGGRVVGGDNYSRKHVMVPTGHNAESLAPAFIGNWITTLVKTRSFRVYKEKSFHEAFRGVMSEEKKFAVIHEKLLQIARAQDVATYHGDSSGEVLLLVEKTAREICGMA